MTTYKIIPNQKSRLDQLLRTEIPHLTKLEISNSKIRRLIMAGCIKVNGKEIRIPSFTVFSGSKVEVFVDEEKILFEKQADDVKFEVTSDSVLYEDDYLILVNKPSRFPTEKTIVTDRDNLHDAIVRYLWAKNPSLRNPPYCGIMHRLDRETSGVILFTKKREVNKAIFDMFDSAKLNLESPVAGKVKNEGKKSGGAGSEKIVSIKTCSACNEKNAGRKSGSEGKYNTDGNTNRCGQSDNFSSYRPVSKTYIAAVKDSPKIKDSFTVKNFLGRITSKSQGCKWGSVPQSRGGLIAVTEFKVVNRKGGICYLECHPVTGRTHQIRVHLAENGTPILGDTIYGGPKAERLCLHAKSLELIHPVTGEKLKVESTVDF